MIKLIEKLIKTSKKAVEIFNTPVLDNEMVLQEEKTHTNNKTEWEPLDKRMAQIFYADMRKINIVNEFNKQLEKIKSIEKGQTIIDELNKIQNNYNGIKSRGSEFISDYTAFANFITRHTTDKTNFELWKNIFVERIAVIKDCVRAFSTSINKSIAEYKNLIDAQIACFNTFNYTLSIMKKPV